jgi:hypothetical protein
MPTKALAIKYAKSMRIPSASRGMVKDDGCAGLHRSGTGDNRFHPAFQALWEVLILDHYRVNLHIHIPLPDNPMCKQTIRGCPALPKQ